MDTHPRPLQRPGRLRRVAPFAGAAALALVAMPLPPQGDLALEVLAAALTVLIVAAAVLLPWEGSPSSLQAVPPLAYFAVIAIIRHAEGGAQSGYSALVLLPIFWMALHGTRNEMWAGLALMAFTLIAPIVVVGDPAYPVSEWRRAVIWLAIAPLVGVTTQRLVEDVRRHASEQETEARTDPLTGLPNRRALDERLAMELARAQRDGAPISVAMLDIDHFKRFNDAEGHQAGDLLLKEAAAAWRATIRETDTLARYGGEEFAMLLPGAGLRSAEELVERVRAAMPSAQSCSAGIAAWDGSESAVDLFSRADAALYRAKETGRDRVVLATPR